MYKFIQASELIKNYSDSQEVRDFYSEVLALRFKGYRRYYGTGSVPLDHYDLIGDHMVIAKKEDNKWRPVLCLRSITVNRCEKHNNVFPFVGHMFHRMEGEIVNASSQFIKENGNVCYTNNYTMDPDLPKEEKGKLAELLYGYYYLFHKEYGVSKFITAAGDRFKLYNVRIGQGYEYLKSDTEFSTFEAEHIMNEKFRVMVMREFSDYSKNISKECEQLFREREILDTTSPKETAKAA